MFNKSLMICLILTKFYPILAQQEKKCTLKDSKCQQDYFTGLAVKYVFTGIPQLGIPVIDPYELENVTISVLGINITLVKGESPGVSTCRNTYYNVDVDKFRKTIEIICKKISIKGHYTIQSDNSLLYKLVYYYLFGGSVSGDGQGCIDMENWYFKFDYPFAFVRHDDGEIYLKNYYNETIYTSEVRGKATFSADSILVGDEERSSSILQFLNKHSSYILRMVQQFHELSVEYYYYIYDLFSNLTPAGTYLSDDLSIYVIN